ncbi:MAG: mannose-1-phosphate guanylyltransferase [bacterium]
MVDNVLIMAGGTGTRLWPASIRRKPKQFMDPGLGKSLLRATIDRALALEPAGRIIIVTHQDHVPGAVEECRALESTHRGRIVILAEPIGRNTAPAIAFGLAYLSATGAGADSETTLILPADHLVSPPAIFVQATERADFLARENYLVTFGIRPTRPETGYGYIEAGRTHGPGRLVSAFKEKPDRETAEKYVAAERYYWNSGMFVFRARTFFDELARHHPEIAEPFRALDATADELAADTSLDVPVVGRTPGLQDLYTQLPSISVDYAVMEQSSCTAVVPADFSWSDIGSWDEIAGLQSPSLAQEGDADGHVVAQTQTDSAVVEVEATDNVVLSDTPVALCGVSGLIVVQRNGKLLIYRRGESQLVKEVVEELKATGREEWL